MRSLRLLLILFAFPILAACQQSAYQATESVSALNSALVGRWIGFLEYRDYSESATSTKRVQLPTWLTISQGHEGLSFDYVYDDGPTKVVTSHDTVVINLQSLKYMVLSKDSAPETDMIAGADKLKNGRGELTLSGEGKDADKPAELRTTLTIRRNLLSWLEEVRPAKSEAPFVFRHRYTFVRAETPSPTPAK